MPDVARDCAAAIRGFLARLGSSCGEALRAGPRPDEADPRAMAAAARYAFPLPPRRVPRLHRGETRLG